MREKKEFTFAIKVLLLFLVEFSECTFVVVLELDSVFRKLFEDVVYLGLESEKLVETLLGTLDLLENIIAPAETEVFDDRVHVLGVDNLANVGELVELRGEVRDDI